MMNKLTWALLGLLCVVPAFHAAPASSESSEELTVKGLVERLKLLALTIDGFSELHTDILERGPKIFNAVLKDPKVIDVKTDSMAAEIKKIQDYLDKFEKVKEEDKNEHVFELVDEFDDVLTLFDSDQHDLSPDAAIIEKSLEEHGLADLSKSIHEHFEKFLLKFQAEVDKYIGDLSEKEKEGEKKFIDWYEKLKTEKDTDTKIEMFDNFIDNDDD